MPPVVLFAVLYLHLHSTDLCVYPRNAQASPTHQSVEMWRVSAEGFSWRLSVYSPPACPPCLYSGGQWQHSYGCISLTYFPSADWWVLTERMPLSRTLSHADPISTVVFLIPVDRKLFSLPLFPACPWQAYFLHGVCGRALCMRERECMYVCVHVCLCVYVRVCLCVRTSVKQKLLLCQCQVCENGSASEGQPLLLHWASHSVPKSQMPLSDVGSLLFVHETTTENIVILWDWPNDLRFTSLWTRT